MAGVSDREGMLLYAAAVQLTLCLQSKFRLSASVVVLGLSLFDVCLVPPMSGPVVVRRSGQVVPAAIEASGLKESHEVVVGYPGGKTPGASPVIVLRVGVSAGVEKDTHDPTVCIAYVEERWLGLFVPQPTCEEMYQLLTLADLPCAVRGRSPRSAGASRRCY